MNRKIVRRGLKFNKRYILFIVFLGIDCLGMKGVFCFREIDFVIEL